MLGFEGLRKATEYAILNANYMRARLKNEFDILYTGSKGTCAHEFIIDLRPFKRTAEIEAEDVAKTFDGLWFPCSHHELPCSLALLWWSPQKVKIKLN